MIPAFSYLSTHIHLAEGSDHLGHTFPQILMFSLCQAGGKEGEGSLAHPEASHRGSLLGKHALFAVVYSSRRDPYHPSRWYYGAKILIWGIFPVLGQACSWP